MPSHHCVQPNAATRPSASGGQPGFPDYQSLPSPPDATLSVYDPDFGAAVTAAYRASRFREHLRRQKYGDELARTWKCGSTPEEARKAYWTRQEEALRKMNAPSSGTPSSGTPTPDATTRNHAEPPAAHTAEAPAAIYALPSPL